MKTRLMILTLVNALWLSSLPCPAQSVADLARKEREKREQQKSRGKVFTNEDLNKYGSQPDLREKSTSRKIQNQALQKLRSPVPMKAMSVPGASDSSSVKPNCRRPKTKVKFCR